MKATWFRSLAIGMALLAFCSASQRPADVKARGRGKAQGVGYYTLKKRGVTLQIIDANLNSPQVYVTIETADNFPYGATKFETMARRSGAVAAMTGAYADSKTYLPIGDMAIKGKMIFRGDFRSGLVITKDNQASVRRLDRSDRSDLFDMETLLSNSPVLLRDGLPDYKPDVPRHRDPHVTGKTSRMGVGVTKNNHLLMVASNGRITFAEWAQVMKELGCRDALNLDSGSSRAMYFNGHTIFPAGRLLSHILVVKFRENGSETKTIPTAFSGAPKDKHPPKVQPPGTVLVRVCAETHKRANDYCDTFTTEFLKKPVKLKFCTKHHAKL